MFGFSIPPFGNNRLMPIFGNERSVQTEQNIVDAVGRRIPLFGDIVILAIGSDRVTGDCLGPLVGHLLSLRGLTVYGGLQAPVTALNVGEIHAVIRQRHPSAFVIAVDSAVGDDREIGTVRVMPRGLKPGAATGKTLPRVGDVSVLGIVSPERLGAKALGEVRLGKVLEMAHLVADGIEQAVLRRKNILAN